MLCLTQYGAMALTGGALATGVDGASIHNNLSTGQRVSNDDSPARNNGNGGIQVHSGGATEKTALVEIQPWVLLQPQLKKWRL